MGVKVIREHLKDAPRGFYAKKSPAEAGRLSCGRLLSWSPPLGLAFGFALRIAGFGSLRLCGGFNGATHDDRILAELKSVGYVVQRFDFDDLTNYYTNKKHLTDS